MKDLECILIKTNKKPKMVTSIFYTFYKPVKFYSFSYFLLFPIPISLPSVIAGEERRKSSIAKMC